MRKDSQTPARRPRSDAQRNRSRILEVAKDSFTRHGGDASLDEIAKQAGVGPGTLYRHFPTRGALLEAVYRTEVEKLAAAGPRFSAELPPLEALRAWMLLFIDYMAAKHIIAPALKNIVGGPDKLYEDSRSLMQQAIDELVSRAKKSGDLKKNVHASDLLRAVVGVSYVGLGDDWQKSARRLVDILLAGSRSAEPGASRKWSGSSRR